MNIFKEKNQLIKFLSNQKQNIIIGFVPTMGSLHQGHLSLIKESQKKCDLTVCSIYVNPTQFNDKADFKNYPKDLNKDLNPGVLILFWQFTISTLDELAIVSNQHLSMEMFLLRLCLLYTSPSPRDS